MRSGNVPIWPSIAAPVGVVSMVIFFRSVHSPFHQARAGVEKNKMASAPASRRGQSLNLLGLTCMRKRGCASVVGVGAESQPPVVRPGLGLGGKRQGGID